METFETIKNKNLLLYSYIRGSHCHGISTPQSDVDEGGIFISPVDSILDLGFNYQDQISNKTNDVVWYELKKFMHLLIKSNPTILEALFIDDKFVTFEHPIITDLKKYKDEFLTKKCFNSFFGYAEAQIKKAKGLNKMINWEADKIKRKGILDFAYTFHKQGSTKIENWLEYRGLNQKYCGLVNIPNMKDIYGVYYDWGNFFLNENITYDDIMNGYYSIGHFDAKKIVEDIKSTEKEEEKATYNKFLKMAHLGNMVEFIINKYDLHDKAFIDYEMENLDLENLKVWFESQKPIGYKGMVGENSNSLRLSSVSKGEMPICYVSYNKDGYIKHCTDYKNFKDWEKNRNPIRYQSNLKKNYDSKNMCECFRLLHCGIEIANGNGFIVDRSGIDRDFLLDVKNHKFEYDEIVELLEKDKAEMETAMKQSTIKDDIDQDLVNSLYLSYIKEFYGCLNVK